MLYLLLNNTKGDFSMSITGEKLVKGSYTCTKCGQVLILDDHKIHYHHAQDVMV